MFPFSTNHQSRAVSSILFAACYNMLLVNAWSCLCYIVRACISTLLCAFAQDLKCAKMASLSRASAFRRALQHFVACNSYSYMHPLHNNKIDHRIERYHAYVSRHACAWHQLFSLFSYFLLPRIATFCCVSVPDREPLLIWKVLDI